MISPGLTSRSLASNSSKERLITLLFSRFRDLLGPQFMKRLSSSSLCHCLLRQQNWHQIDDKNIKLEKHYNDWKEGRFWGQNGSKFKSFFVPFLSSSVSLLVAASVFVRGKDFIFIGFDNPQNSLVLVSAEEENEGESITDDLMASHKGDLEYIKSLIKSTLTCSTCGNRHFIDQKVENVTYCHCKDKKPSVYGVKVNDEAWTPFLERKNILVWRQEHPDLPGLYAYKMYGRFDDVTADEFLDVQTDLTDFRLSWDKGTAQCHVLEHLDQEGKTI